MLLGSFIAGMLPLTLNLSESKMRHITILGAGLLIGTALAVIVPEGIHTLYSNQKCVPSHSEHEHHVHKRDLQWASEAADENNNLHDEQAIRLFYAQLSHDKNINKRDLEWVKSKMADEEAVRRFYAMLSQDKNVNVNKRDVEWAKNKMADEQAIRLFYAQLSHDKNINKRDLEWAKSKMADQEAIQLFYAQLSRDKNINKRDLEWVKSKIADEQAIRLFYAQLSSDKNLSVRSLMKRLVETDELSDAQKIEMFLACLNGNRIIKLDEKAPIVKRDQEEHLTDEQLIELFLNQLNARMNTKNKLIDLNGSSTLSRSKRDTIEQNKPVLGVDDVKREMVNAKPNSLSDNKSGGESEGHYESNAHSAIGVTLVLGFAFMLFVDQIGGKIGHRPHQSLDPQSIRNKITFSTTLGLIVHAAADGIALGAAAATSRTDVEMIVFFAIMLHKAPAAFGLVSFLIHEGLDRARVRKHLAVFALAAPVMAIITYLALKSGSNVNMVSSNSTGICMLFSAGTFLYVSTVHVLPEVQAHNEDRQFRFAETMSFVVGAVIPLFLSIGHGH